MGRSHRGSRSDSEWSEAQRLRHENQKLKKQIAKLRKELSKIDIDRYSDLKDELEAQEGNANKEYELQRLKEKWICHVCGKDYLRVILVPRADGMFYLRKCVCGNRTKLKRYTENVDGIDSNDKPIKHDISS